MLRAPTPCRAEGAPSRVDRAAGLPAEAPPAWACRPLPLLAIVAAAALLRLCWIDSASFWRNELFSLFWAKRPLLFLWTEGMRLETNPPLYFTLLKLWTALFGDSVAAVRALSALGSLFALPLVYALGREMGRPVAGLLAAAILAISPSHIYFANEARAYALMPPLFALALLMLFRLTRPPSARIQPRYPAWYLATYAASGAMLIYLHVSAVFLLAAAALAFTLHAIDTRLPWRRAAAIPAGLGIALLAALPELAAAFAQRSSPNIEWIPPAGAATLAGMLRFPFFGPYPHWEVVQPVYTRAVWYESAFAAVLFALAVRGALRDTARRQEVVVLAAIAVMFLSAVTFVSLARPMMLPRIMMGVTIPCALLLGLALSAARLPARAALAGAVAAASVSGLVQTQLTPAASKPDWRALLPRLVAQAAPTDLVAVGSHASVLGLAQAPYGLCGRFDLRRFGDKPEAGMTASSWLEQAVCRSAAIGTDGLTAEIARGRPVWLILDTADIITWHNEGARGRPPAPSLREDMPGLTLMAWLPGE